MMKFPLFKVILSRIGVLVPPRWIHYCNGILNYLSVGRWFRDRGLAVPVRLPDRPELYAYLAAQVTEPATYLEFGVFRGTSMAMWAGHLKSPQSQFAGFDSFEGLPENWGYFTAKQRFDVKGQMPKFDDARIQLVKGWFEQTVPAFLARFQPQSSLVVHLDADLYSSTIFVLRQLRPHLREGSLLIFDEFFDREHEMKAFSEFLADEAVQIECVAATRALTQVAFRVTQAARKPSSV
jgi:hypothetical protein